MPLVDSGFGVPGAVEEDEPFIPFDSLDLLASLVENIRVRRFVIEGFSVAVTAFSGFCGSESGAAWPLTGSEVFAIPFCVGRPSDAPIDDVREAGCERGVSFGSDFGTSRGALTVAMVCGKVVMMWWRGLVDVAMSRNA